MQSRRGIGIAGTHGKSTTAAMTAAALCFAGREPSACIGAELCGLGTGGWLGHGDLFVAECCEFRRSFLDLSPTYAAILNVEPDHFDYFRNLEETREAFRQFAARVSPEGLLVVRSDCQTAVETPRPSTRSPANSRFETFSLGPPATWIAENLRRAAEGASFDVVYRRSLVGRFTLRVPGPHNVLNALAAIALCRGVGLEFSEIRAGLAEFRGVCRRFRIVGDAQRNYLDRRLRPSSDRSAGDSRGGAPALRAAASLVSFSATPGLAIADPAAGVCREL